MGEEYRIERVSEVVWQADPRLHQYEPLDHEIWPGGYTLPPILIETNLIPFGDVNEVRENLRKVWRNLPKHLLEVYPDMDSDSDIDLDVKEDSNLCRSVYFNRHGLVIPHILEHLNKIYPVCLMLYLPAYAWYDLEGYKRQFMKSAD